MLKAQYFILRKAAKGDAVTGHKYLTRKPDGRGGWHYVYSHVVAGPQERVHAREAASHSQALSEARKALDVASDSRRVAWESSGASAFSRKGDPALNEAMKTAFANVAKHRDAMREAEQKAGIKPEKPRERDVHFLVRDGKGGVAAERETLAMLTIGDFAMQRGKYNHYDVVHTPSGYMVSTGPGALDGKAEAEHFIRELSHVAPKDMTFGGASLDAAYYAHAAAKRLAAADKAKKPATKADVPVAPSEQPTPAPVAVEEQSSGETPIGNLPAPEVDKLQAAFAAGPTKFGKNGSISLIRETREDGTPTARFKVRLYSAHTNKAEKDALWAATLETRKRLLAEHHSVYKKNPIETYSIGGTVGALSISTEFDVVPRGYVKNSSDTTGDGVRPDVKPTAWRPGKAVQKAAPALRLIKGGKMKPPYSEKQRRWAFVAEREGKLPAGDALKWSRRAKGRGMKKSCSSCAPSAPCTGCAPTRKSEGQKITHADAMRAAEHFGVQWQHADWTATDLQAGMRVELEHTRDMNKAAGIALDHLCERSDYYKKLRTLEDGAQESKTVFCVQRRALHKSDRENPNHKYSKKLPDGKGGWVYIYDEPKKTHRKEQADPKMQAQLSQAKKTAIALQDLIKQGKLSGSLASHVALTSSLLRKHSDGMDKFKAALADAAPSDAKVKARTKEMHSVLGKIVSKTQAGKARYKDAHGLQDMTGARIVCKSVQDVKSTVANLKKNFTVVEGDDYVDEPKDGQQGLGYRSHHLILRDKDGLEKEVQIRTPSQDKHADWCHDVYKPVNAAQSKIMEEKADEISQYARNVSDYFYHVESGKMDVAKVPCPESVKLTFGCL